MKKTFTLLSFVVAGVCLNAQTYKNDEKHEFTGLPVYSGAAVSADVNSDGLPDVMVFGEHTDNNPTIELINGRTGEVRTWAINKGGAMFKNNGDGTYTEITVPFSGFWNGQLRVADIDGDNSVDVITGRWDPEGTVFATNDGSGNYTVIPSPGFDVASGYLSKPDQRDVFYVDFNNDGIMDILDAGNTNKDANEDRISVYIMTSGGSVSIENRCDLPVGLWDPNAFVADFNGDGFKDFIIMGGDQAEGNPHKTFIFINNGDGSFGNADETTFSGKWWGGANGNDFNGDGLIDIVIAGGNGAGNDLVVYKNDGGGAFSAFQTITPGYITESFSNGCVRFVDYDNDGKMNLAIGGKLDGVGTLDFYKLNAGGTAFELDCSVQGGDRMTFDFADFNNDGKIDVLRSGDAAKTDARIFYSQAANANTKPGKPTNLSQSIVGGKLVFSWDAGTDTETPVNSLTYNIALYDKSAGKYIISPLADTATGLRKISDIGNNGFNKSITLSIPTDGSYTFKVQSIDGGFMGSEFASLEVSSVNNPALAALGVYPNPVTNGIINIANTENITAVAIYSVDGRSLLSVNNNFDKIDVKGLNAGMYIIKIDLNNQSITDKIIIR
ncbi:MAG: T9SS type A sorting domain-containing protein [Bacteroidales bacterium]|nr:T9SS type A sorting domain-containing protein [Bacteroidales bacterium]